jgi:LysR family transcriptional regulator, nod-box dependent transcriptional activator
MFLRGLDLNLLLVLDVLLQERHVTRASARLLRSQPAVSAMLARLREYFGDELLRRSGRDVELTPFAAELIGPLHDFIEKAEGLISMQRAKSLADLDRTFTIGMSDSVAEILAVHLVNRLERVAPHVVIRMKGIDHTPFELGLERGETDFMIAPSETVQDDKLEDFVIEELIVERLVCIGDRDRTKAADIQDLDKFAKMPFVAVRFSDGTRLPMAERPFERLGIQRNIKAFVPYFQLLPALVEHSDRIGIVHERTALGAIDRYNIAIFEPPIEMPPLVLNLISHARNSASLQFQWLRTVIRESARAP